MKSSGQKHKIQMFFIYCYEFYKALHTLLKTAHILTKTYGHGKWLQIGLQGQI